MPQDPNIKKNRVGIQKSDLRTLSIATIPLLSEGKVGQVIDTAIRTMIADLDARPGNNKARKVTITLTGTPVSDVSDISVDLVAIDHDVNVKVVLPPQQSVTTQLVPDATKPGVAYFQPQSPANARQEPLNLTPDVDENGVVIEDD